MVPVFEGEIVDGNVVLQDPRGYNNYVRTLKGVIQLSVKRKTKRITAPEMRYYFGVIIPILRKELGFTIDQMDDAIKYKFCRRFDEHDLLILPSKTEWSTIFTESIFEEIRMWAANDLGVIIPLPNEVEY